MAVLSHLALRFSSHPENLATEALAYILRRSQPARQALDRYASALVGRDLGLTRFETQSSNEDQSRPDLIGRTDAGERRLLTEVKFWAGLTDAQPVGYLASMDTPGVLLFVAPEARVQPLWRELLRRCADAGLLNGSEPDSNLSKLKVEIGAHTLALTSWRVLLGHIGADVHAAGDMAAAADLRQLSDLCDHMDTEAFLPLTSEELTANLGRRIMQFGDIASELTEILVRSGQADVKGLRATSRPGSHGRYLRLVGRNAYLHFGAAKWAKFGDSPIWLSFYDQDYPITASVLQSAGWPVFEDENQCHVPITVLTGVERPAVIEAALIELIAIAGALPPTQPHAEAAPPEAVA